MLSSAILSVVASAGGSSVVSSSVRLSVATSGILLVRLHFFPLVGFFDCFSRSFASFSDALHSFSSFLCFSSSSSSIIFPFSSALILQPFISFHSLYLGVLSIVNTRAFPVVTFFFGLFATGILSN